MEIKAREKDQENRLAELKLKELRRNLRHKTLRPLNGIGTPKTIVKGKDLMFAKTSPDKDKVKILMKKTLENGKLTYQDAGLTESNVKLLE